MVCVTKIPATDVLARTCRSPVGDCQRIWNWTAAGWLIPGNRWALFEYHEL
jgi:hypothetical protein